MSIFDKKQKTWDVNLTTIQDKQVVEVCEPKGYSTPVSIYNEVLGSLLSQWPVLVASQVIDIREFTSKETFNLLSTAINNHAISMTMTKGFTDCNVLDEYNSEFAIHVTSNNSVSWVPSLLRFGSVSLPHVIYCCNEIDGLIDIKTLCQMNLDFVSWSQVSGDDETIIKLGAKIPLIYWAGDFRMYFFSSPEIASRVIDGVDKIAHLRDIKMVLQQKNHRSKNS